MTDNPESHRQSLYAPLQPLGPLPPGLTENVVNLAYRSANLKPIRVLRLMGIPAESWTALPRLRRELDDPDFRERLSRKRHDDATLAFHEILYRYLRAAEPHGRAVHARLITPAIDSDDKERSWLNADRFIERLKLEQNDLGSVATPVTPGSEAEALVLFTLAFTLLQPGIANSVLNSLVALSPAFRDFFGLNLISSSHQESCPDLDEPTPIRATEVTPASVVPATPDAPSSSTETNENERSIHTNAGAWIAKLENHRTALKLAREERQRLGRAHDLDAAALERTISIELAASRGLAAFEESLALAVNDTLADIAALLQQHIPHAAVAGPEPATVARAAWLDRILISSARLRDEVSALERKITLLQELGNKHPLPLFLSDRVETCEAALDAVDLICRLASALNVHPRELFASIGEGGEQPSSSTAARDNL